MFLDRLIIADFGLFRGTHVLDFRPKAADRPVILIGGLNGSGKTTILNALQLALYGNRAKVSNRNALSFSEYIRRSINDSSGGMGCSISLSFTRRIDAEERGFEINRKWSISKDQLKEELAVSRNGEPDQLLTETWAEFVEEVIPIDIADLFFFDGERIEGFADPETSRHLLTNGVNTLLGLNLITRLQADLSTLEKRKSIELKSTKVKAELDALERSIESLGEERQAIITDRAQAQSRLDRRGNELRRAQKSYSTAGGTLFDQRETFEQERTELARTLQENEIELRVLAEGVAPLLLVRNLLESIQQQHAAETLAADSALVQKILADRDDSLKRLMQSLAVNDEARSAIESFVDQDREKRSMSQSTEIYLNLSPEGADDLADLAKRSLPEAEKAIHKALRSNSVIQHKIVEADRKLAAIPDQDFLLDYINKRDEIQVEIDVNERLIAELEDRTRRIEVELGQAEAKYRSLLEATVQERLEAEDAARTVEHSSMVRKSLERFRGEVVKRHTERIATLVLDSFRRLLRKNSLVSDLTIDFEDFGLTLFDTEGRVRSPERLSAGERQLLAVSLLWGLARSSGYPLPVVVDTPLGRLDGKHRDNLVENYYPEASHQVILLSTNKEIDADLFAKLEPSISSAYLLEYSDETHSTDIKIGYFDNLWQSSTSNFLSKQKTNSSS